MSDQERNEIVGGFVLQKVEAQRKLAVLDVKLKQLGDRLEQLGRALRRGDLTYEALRELLRFGPESGITAEGLEEFLRERERLMITVRDLDIQLRNLGVL